MEKIRKLISKIICGDDFHIWTKWKAESDPKRCIFWFHRTCTICGKYERRDF